MSLKVAEWDQRNTLKPPPLEGAFKKYLKGLNVADSLLSNAHSFDDPGVKQVLKCPFASANTVDLKVADPEWVDWELVEKGQKIWIKNTGRFFAALNLSLLTGFSTGRFAEVLLNSGYGSSPQKAFFRYADTGFAIVDWMNDSLRVGGKGRQSVYTVRIMHEKARRAGKNLFDQSKGEGVPLSQYDLAEVLLGFAIVSIVIIEMNMKVEFSLEEKEAMTATWRLIGHLIGIEDEFNPCASWKEMNEIYDDYSNWLVPRLEMRRPASDFIQEVTITGFGQGTGLGNQFFVGMLASFERTIKESKNQVIGKLSEEELEAVRVTHLPRLPYIENVGDLILGAYKFDFFNDMVSKEIIQRRDFVRSLKLKSKKKRFNLRAKLSAISFYHWRVVSFTYAYKHSLRAFFTTFIAFVLLRVLRRKRLL